jgi:hypothetical protein
MFKDPICTKVNQGRGSKDPLFYKNNPEADIQVIHDFIWKTEKKLAIIAKDKSEELFPQVETDLGVRDAYRHILWLALIE